MKMPDLTELPALAAQIVNPGETGIVGASLERCRRKCGQASEYSPPYLAWR